MITKTIAAGIIALSTLSAVPANAGGFSVEFGGGPGWGYHDGNGYRGGYDNHRDWRHGRLSTDQVRFILRQNGYRAIRFFDDHGPVYQLRASQHGRDYFLVVSARTGEILSSRRV